MKSVFFVYSAFVIRVSFSFTPSLSSNTRGLHPSTSCTSTALNLVPDQGCQLAAASAAEFAKKKLEQNTQDKHEISSSRSTTTTSTLSSQQQQQQQQLNDRQEHSEKQLKPIDATREFASRLFNIPFGRKQQQHPQAEFQPSFEFKIPGLDDHNEENNDDVVLFPIVGFQYVKLQDGTIRGIPTINASPEKAVCNFESKNQSMTQPVHGWYSQCCILGDLYSDDDDEYCGQARFLKLEEMKCREFEPHPSEMLGWYKESN